MEKNNSIINSLKRLERVGSETSRVTKKLKKAASDVANLIFEKVLPFKNDFDEYEGITWTRITGENEKSGLFLVETRDDICLIYDYAYEANMYNFEKYMISESTTYQHEFSRNIALRLSSLISGDILNEVAMFIERKNNYSKKMTKKILNVVNNS
jgi:hypothetical protein